jgi:hypothetical protein|tara:strand:- start:873 stop:1322 length:450 start_codon:yes stop_codon:yes gene_type:complete
MPVIDVVFTKLEAYRKKPAKDADLKGGIKVNSHTGMESITKEKVGTLGECLLVEYLYHVGYEPDIGGIDIRGRVVYHAKKLTQVCDNKDGNIVLKPQAFAEVQNAILSSSTVQALLLSRDIKLPPSIQLPRVKVDDVKEAEEAKGSKAA